MHILLQDQINLTTTLALTKSGSGRNTERTVDADANAAEFFYFSGREGRGGAFASDYCG